MSPPELLVLLTGVLQFPKAILELIKVLKNTPEEKHDALVKHMIDEAYQFSVTGRPKW